MTTQSIQTAKSSTYLGLFLLTMVTVSYEILLTRIFSVTMWYHFAFVAISVAMFGMSVGAVLVYVMPHFFTEQKTGLRMAQSSLGFSATMIASYLYHRSVPFLDDFSLKGMLSLACMYMVTALPFIFGGIAVCLALTRFGSQTSKLYAVDLVGAALGCIVPIALLRFMSAPAAIFALALIATIACVCFANEESLSMRRLVFAGLGICAIALVLNYSLGGSLLRLQYIKGQREGQLLYEKWNHFSRITVVDQPLSASPMAWGMSPNFHQQGKPQKELMLWMDSPAAATPITQFDGSFDNLSYLHFDIVNLVHYLRHDAKVLVVGTGGGRDLLSALAFGQKSVVGVEINQDILGTLNGRYGDFSGHLDRDPRVTFVNDEARSYVARQPERFDVIQVSLVDTFAASAAGAFVLTENSLYTTQAWHIFLSKLSDNGIVTFSRWYFPTRPAEMYRLTALATQSLLDEGITAPREHIVIARRDGALGVGTILVSKRPFSAEEIQTVMQICQQMGFEPVLTPNSAMDSFLADIANGRNLESVVASYPLNIAPPTDDSPFFFNLMRLRDIFSTDQSFIGLMSWNTRAVFILGCLAMVVIVLTAGCIVGPLVLFSGRQFACRRWPMFIYFGAIGLGFMFIELSQMQRLVVFLGHPTYALSVVLFSLLTFSGLGSYSTAKIGKPEDGTRRLVLLFCLLAVFGAVTPLITNYFQSSTTPVRMMVAVAILAPIGFFMGMAFPLGMKLTQQNSGELTSWLWGTNGATSVCASVLAVVFSMAFGIHVAFWIGVAAYLAAGAAYIYELKSPAEPEARYRAAAASAS